jgi:hypothetical protein
LVLEAPKGLDEDEDGLGDFAGVDLARYVGVVTWDRDIANECYRGFEKIGKYHTNDRPEADGWA